MLKTPEEDLRAASFSTAPQAVGQIVNEQTGPEPALKTRKALALHESRLKQLKFVSAEGKTALRDNCGKKCILAALNTAVNYCWAASTKQLKPYFK